MWYASVIFFHFFQSSIKYRFEFRQIATFTYEILWQSSVPSHRGKSPEKFHDTRRDRRNRTNTITCPKSCWIFGKYKKYSEYWTITFYVIWDQIRSFHGEWARSLSDHMSEMWARSDQWSRSDQFPDHS